MSTYVGRTKLSRCADFERATIALSGKGRFIFQGWEAKPAVLSKEWYEVMELFAAHNLWIGKVLNPADPVEFFHLQVIQGQPVPAPRCNEIADAFESLREGFRNLDKAEATQWSVEPPEGFTLEYHLNAYINELRACTSDNRAFAYAV
ncbi:hypothetical protein [Pseudomonas serbica]|uniref:hypothetical protein n=1 Tax=Pseudomonas serbica TaxID=2965074 RepID=UPI00237B56E2|nr:hypothetical protein [Pseudomonas serbica]